MKASIEEVGGHVAHGLNRNLNALGTIAAITPLLGLLGTVIGMISVFTNITTVGVGNPAQLAGGIEWIVLLLIWKKSHQSWLTYCKSNNPSHESAANEISTSPQRRAGAQPHTID